MKRALIALVLLVPGVGFADGVSWDGDVRLRDRGNGTWRGYDMNGNGVEVKDRGDDSYRRYRVSDDNGNSVDLHHVYGDVYRGTDDAGNEFQMKKKYSGTWEIEKQ